MAHGVDLSLALLEAQKWPDTESSQNQRLKQSRGKQEAK